MSKQTTGDRIASEYTQQSHNTETHTKLELYNRVLSTFKELLSETSRDKREELFADTLRSIGRMNRKKIDLSIAEERIDLYQAIDRANYESKKITSSFAVLSHNNISGDLKASVIFGIAKERMLKNPAIIGDYEKILALYSRNFSESQFKNALSTIFEQSDSLTQQDRMLFENPDQVIANFTTAHMIHQTNSNIQLSSEVYCMTYEKFQEYISREEFGTKLTTDTYKAWHLKNSLDEKLYRQDLKKTLSLLGNELYFSTTGKYIREETIEHILRETRENAITKTVNFFRDITTSSRTKEPGISDSLIHGPKQSGKGTSLRM